VKNAFVIASDGRGLSDYDSCIYRSRPLTCLEISSVVISPREQHLFQAIPEIRILVELTVDYSASGIVINVRVSVWSCRINVLEI